ncbi:DoxX family protein [Chitinophaga caseinilytica]|uniref:DoxX family protein n=1 Tax=Chitinophaga caseinilytica TaxID=2267521 RepID=A0ABZ2Z242_9BACT
MNLLQRIERWGDNHHPKWVDGLRILLGLFLMWKGIQFVDNIDLLKSRIAEQPFLTAVSFWLAHYIVFAHTVGGLFIALGLLTRVGVIANLPVLIGAVFFINSSTNLFSVYPEMSLSIVVLLGLLFFLVEGSGRVSVDEYMRTHPEKSAA